MIDLSSVKVNSIGSSIVTMCMRSRLLMYWSIDAIVVDFPEPVTPASRTIPWSYWVISAMIGREAQAREVGDGGAHAAGDQAEPPPLAEQVDAEPGLGGAVKDDVGEVDAARVFEDRLLPGRQQREHQPFHVVRGEHGQLHLPEDARQSHGRGETDLEVEVGTLMLHHHPEEFVRLGLAGVDLHHRFRHGRHDKGLLRAKGSGSTRQSGVTSA